MKRALFIACVILVSPAAEARPRCPPDKFWRVSLGRCVSKKAQPQYYTVRFGATRERTPVKGPVTTGTIVNETEEIETAPPEMPPLPWPTDGRSFNQLPKWERK